MTAPAGSWAAAASGRSTGSTTPMSPDPTASSLPTAWPPARSSPVGVLGAGRTLRGDHHDGVPILVLTSHVDEGDIPPGTARFYTDVEACAADARAAAGGRDVSVHGAGAGQALIHAPAIPAGPRLLSRTGQVSGEVPAAEPSRRCPAPPTGQSATAPPCTHRRPMPGEQQPRVRPGAAGRCACGG